MKVIVLLAVFICGCQVIPGKDELGLDKTQSITNEKEFWKMPCIWDGTILNNINEKLKPKSY